MRAIAFFIMAGSCAALLLPQSAGAEAGVSGHKTSVTPVARTASRPAVTTDGARATSATEASVEGNADPEGQSTTLYAAYALASDRWCTSHGAKGKPSKTRPRSIGSSRAILSEILVKVTGLAAGSKYCTELVAKNQSGTSHGGQVRFATPANTAQSTAKRTVRIPPTRLSPRSSSWPVAASVTVALLGATVLVLGIILVRARVKRGSRRRGSTKPAAG